jgi:hypothetical protein
MTTPHPIGFRCRILAFGQSENPHESDHEAESVCRMLGKAYDAGYEAAKQELRGWLETPKRKWGDDR